MNTEIINCFGLYLENNMTAFPFAEKSTICFFDKGETGCGGTTFAAKTALNNKDKVIILMPSVNSVQSKQTQSDFIENADVTCLYGRCSDVRSEAHVIFATYDKMRLIKNTLGDRLIKYKLLIDEYHTPARDASFRRIMIEILNDWNKFESVTLMSATPDPYLEEAIEMVYGSSFPIKKIVAKWNRYTKEITINKARYVQRALCYLVAQYIKGEKKGNLYLFYNNIDACNRIIEICDLNTTDYHFLCSSSSNKTTLKSTINDINTNPKKINFLTAAGFEGLDILDEEAQALCVIDMSAPNTIFDWETIIQMSGRCRNTLNDTHILYHQTKGYRKEILHKWQIRLEELLKAQALIDSGSLPQEALPVMKDVIKINGQYIVSPFEKAVISRKKEMFDNTQSFERLKAYLESQNYHVIGNDVSESLPNPKRKHHSVQELCCKLEIGENIAGLTNSRLITSAYCTLGLEKIKKLNYKIPSIKRALESMSKIDEEDQLQAIMGLQEGSWYTSEDLKCRINDVNSILNMGYDDTHTFATLSEMGFVIIPQKKNNIRGFLILRSCQNSSYFTGMAFIKNSIKDVNFFDMFCSLCAKSGNKESFMNRTKSSAIIIARPLNKTDQTLFSEFYNVSESNIRRRETSFNICDFIVLDVDNGKSVEEFNLYMKNNFEDALHYIAPSFSSTEEFPKFRVFIPLDSPLLFFPDIPGGITTQERIKAYKQLKFCLFYDFQDPKCQLWYFSPYQVPERYGNQSCLFSSEHIYNLIEEIVINQRARHRLLLQDKNSIYTREREKEIVQNEKAKFGSKIYPSATIIKIINESPVGNRDRCIFNIVFNHMDAKDIEIIRAGINDAEKLKMFNEKVQRKFGFR